jgi:hypothetical protein
MAMLVPSQRNYEKELTNVNLMSIITLDLKYALPACWKSSSRAVCALDQFGDAPASRRRVRR